MDESLEITQETIASPEQGEITTPVESENAVDTEVDTQPTSEVDVEEDAGEEQVSTPVDNWENDKKSMSGKIKALETENNKYLKSQQLLEALDKAAAGDPDFMKMANKKLVEQGILDESVLEDMGVSNPQATDGNSDPVLKWAQDKMRQETALKNEERSKRESFFESFEERHPDLLSGNERIVRANRSAVGAAAAKYSAETGAKMEDAYEYGYKVIMDPKQLIEEGKLQGLAQAQNSIPTEGAASGGSANILGEIELTSQQKTMARQFGITEEAYAKRLAEE